MAIEVIGQIEHAGVEKPVGRASWPSWAAGNTLTVSAPFDLAADEFGKRVGGEIDSTANSVVMRQPQLRLCLAMA